MPLRYSAYRGPGRQAERPGPRVACGSRRNEQLGSARAANWNSEMGTGFEARLVRHRVLTGCSCLPRNGKSPDLLSVIFPLAQTDTLGLRTLGPLRSSDSAQSSASGLKTAMP